MLMTLFVDNKYAIMGLFDDSNENSDVHDPANSICDGSNGADDSGDDEMEVEDSSN